MVRMMDVGWRRTFAQWLQLHYITGELAVMVLVVVLNLASCRFRMWSRLRRLSWSWTTRTMVR